MGSVTRILDRVQSGEPDSPRAPEVSVNGSLRASYWGMQSKLADRQTIRLQARRIREPGLFSIEPPPVRSTRS